MVRVVIPTHVQTKSRGGHPFTVYPVEVYNNGRSHCVERRYRDFYELHSELKRTLTSSALPDFPPKKIRNLTSRVIEERRLRLQTYLQTLLSHPPLPPPLVSFLELDGDADSLPTETDAEISDVKQLSHRPVIAFSSDSGLTSITEDPSSDSTLPDIVVKGALHALYYSYPYGGPIA